MDKSNEGAASNLSITELFGPPPPRRPIPSNSFNTLVKIFSLFPDQNPFSEYASYAKLPGYLKRCKVNLNNPKQQRSVDFCNDGVYPRGDKEASSELFGSATVEASKLSVHDVANHKGVAEDLCKAVSCSDSKLMIDELGGLDQHKSMNMTPCDEEGTITGMAEANKYKTTDKMPFDEVGVSFRMAEVDKIHDASSDVCSNDSMAIESWKSGEPSASVNIKGNVEGEKNQNNVDVNKSTSGVNEVKSHTHLSAVRKRPDCQEFVNLCVNTPPGEAQRKDKKLCEEKTSQKLSEIGGLTFTAQKSDTERRTVSNGDRKGNQYGIVTMGKTKNSMDKSVKDVNSRKSKLSSISGGISYSMKCGGADLVVRAKIVKQNVCGNAGNFSARKVENDTKCRERVQFSRQELLNLRKMPSISEDILKTIRVIDAEVHGKDQNLAAGKIIRKKRMKRAEMNKKLGVKRLKLKPDLKPKVISTCRRYLKGRCQEGENCKYLHDEVPMSKSKHQNLAKAGTETVADVSIWETTTLDQLKHQLNANVSLSSGIATPISLKEGLAKQASQPAKAPKGLSFLSSEKSSFKDSSNHKEADLFQKSSGATGTSGQPNLATTSTVNLVQTLMDTPPSDATKEIGFIPFLKASLGRSRLKTPANPSYHWVNPNNAPEKSSLQESAKHEKVHSSNRSDDTASTSDQLDKAMPSRVSDVYPSPMSPKPIRALSSGEPLDDHGGGKSQAALPCTPNPDPLIREKKSANGPDKEIQQKLCDSSTSSGQCSTKGGVKDARSTAERALLSTLAFAAKFESGIKMTSAATSEVAKDVGSSSK